jgi:hypothetical protein
MSAPIRAVAVTVPARDEADRVESCLAALDAAATEIATPVFVVLAADRCRDGTAGRAAKALGAARRMGGRVISVDCGSAGAARQVGAVHAVRALTASGFGLEEIWLASTDADTRPAPSWLRVQLGWAGRGFDAVAGLVELDDDPAVPHRTRVRYRTLVAAHGNAHGHSHVHGANLGLRAHWWHRVGGFPPVETGEEHVLWARLRRAGARRVGIHDHVVTSARMVGRAPHGLAALLGTLANADAPAS